MGGDRVRCEQPRGMPCCVQEPPMKSSMDERARKPFFFWLALLLGILVLAAYLFAGWIVFNYGALIKDSGWTATSRDDFWFVSRVDPAGPSAGRLQPGEQVI